jgi:uncharacterized HAD superfamily protein
MIIYVDIDNTICSTEEKEYALAQPMLINIKKVNKLYDEGHTIIYWTARGTVSKKDFYMLTYVQLKKWGCNFHELKMGKPAYDLFIDDKNLNSILHWNEENVNKILNK